MQGVAQQPLDDYPSDRIADAILAHQYLQSFDVRHLRLQYDSPILAGLQVLHEIGSLRLRIIHFASAERDVVVELFRLRRTR